MKFFKLPPSELAFSFAKSSGPGGQKVNKAATKATLRWNLWGSCALSLEQKHRLASGLGRSLTAAGDIVIHAERERSQAQNRAAAAERFYKLLARALTPVKPRRPTKPTHAARARRREQKQRHAFKKQSRQRVAAE